MADFFIHQNLQFCSGNNIYSMETENQQGTNRKNIHIGQEVEVVQKQDQRTGKLTEGIIRRILTKSANHPHGIKVMLESGIVGRVKKVINT